MEIEGTNLIIPIFDLKRPDAEIFTINFVLKSGEDFFNELVIHFDKIPLHHRNLFRIAILKRMQTLSLEQIHLKFVHSCLYLQNSEINNLAYKIIQEERAMNEKKMQREICQNFGKNYGVFLVKKWWIEKVCRCSLLDYVLKEKVSYFNTDLYCQIVLRKEFLSRKLVLNSEKLQFLFYTLQNSRCVDTDRMVETVFMRIHNENKKFLLDNWEEFIDHYQALSIYSQQFLHNLIFALQKDVSDESLVEMSG